MPGTKAGGLKAAATNRKLHGDDFFKRIGAKGGSQKTEHLKGFAANPRLARIAGAKGGRISRRTSVKHKEARLTAEEQELLDDVQPTI